MGLTLKARFGYGSTTATAGTVFQQLVSPAGSGTKKLRTTITSLWYTSGATGHTLSLIRPFANTTVAANAAAGQKVLALTVDPGLFPKGPVAGTTTVATAATAAGDFLVFETTSGTYYYDKVASVAGGSLPGQLAVTMTANLPTNGLLSGALSWLMKAPGGIDVYTGRTNEVLTPPVSTTFSWQDVENGVFSSYAPYEPILISSNNITAAGTLVAVSGGYAA